MGHRLQGALTLDTPDEILARAKVFMRAVLYVAAFGLGWWARALFGAAACP